MEFKKRIMGMEHEYSVVGKLLDISTFLKNGGRLYNDCQHLEYASPECSNPLDALLYDKAGELIAFDNSKSFDANSKVYKNNVDTRGNNFGTHENYMILRHLDESLLRDFFATRILFTGAGKLDSNGGYEISQKAIFMTTATGGASTGNKGFISSKDESHMSDSDYKRLHVTCGEANMSEVAGFLKLGTTSLVLDLLEDGKIPKNTLSPSQSVEFMKVLSGDIQQYGGKALDIQRRHLKAAKRYSGRDEMTDQILHMWADTLDALQKEPMSLDKTVDWVIKKSLLDNIAKKHNVGYDSNLIQNANLQYHDIDRSKSLFYFLQNKGLVARMLDDDAILRAKETPPSDTRAYARGKAVNRGGQIKDWSSIPLSKEGCRNCKFPCNTDVSIGNFPIGDPIDNYAHLFLEKKGAKGLTKDYSTLVGRVIEILDKDKVKSEVVPFKKNVSGLIRVRENSEYFRSYPGFGTISCSCNDTYQFNNGTNSSCMKAKDLEIVKTDPTKPSSETVDALIGAYGEQTRINEKGYEQLKCYLNSNLPAEYLSKIAELEKNFLEGKNILEAKKEFGSILNFFKRKKD